MTHRHQLSLFTSAAAAAPLEALRLGLDPLQQRLIPAHVTLCREDELGEPPRVEVLQALRTLRAPALVMEFGAPERLSGHGLLLPCRVGEPAFQALRRQLLGGSEVRQAAPHLTLAHPRNPPANEAALLAAMQSLAAGLRLVFDSLCLIRQQDQEPWQVLERRPLLKPPG